MRCELRPNASRVRSATNPRRVSPAASGSWARTSFVRNVIRGSLILGLAFIESLALFTLVIVFAKG